jgi:hypothetical protein
MLDRALARTFANLSTLLLVAFVFTMPIHLIQAFVFKDALAVQEIGPEIRTFPEGRQVRGIAKGDLTAERRFLLMCLGAELALIPLAVRAARRVLEVDEQGGVPTVKDAWAHIGTSNAGSFRSGPALVSVGVGGVAGAMLWSITDRLADMASADAAWAVFGLGRALAVGMLVAIVSGTVGGLPDGARVEEKIDLY